MERKGYHAQGTDSMILWNRSSYCKPVQKEGGRPRPNADTRHARPFDVVCERLEETSAFHVDGHRFSKLKLERRLRPQLDVLPACHQCNRRSGARSHGTADQRARAAAGQGANHGSPSGAAADPLPVAFLVVTPNPRVREGTDVVVL